MTDNEQLQREPESSAADADLFRDGRTGELLTPEQWAEQVRRLEANA